MRNLTVNALIAFVLVAAVGCDSKSGEGDAAPAGERIYTSTDYVAAALGMEYTNALLSATSDQAAAESWQWVDEFAAALGVVAPPRDCTENLLLCFGYQRERLGLEIGTQYGARAQVLYEIMIDTALVTMALVFEEEESARGPCNHIQHRSATALVPDSIWRPLCALPAGEERADQILAQHDATREALLTWVETRVDEYGARDPNPQPFVAPAAAASVEASAE